MRLAIQIILALVLAIPPGCYVFGAGCGSVNAAVAADMPGGCCCGGACPALPSNQSGAASCECCAADETPPPAAPTKSPNQSRSDFGAAAAVTIVVANWPIPATAIQSQNGRGVPSNRSIQSILCVWLT